MHARQRRRGAGVDRPDPGVRVRAAQDRGVQHAGHGHVVDVIALPAKESRVLLAGHPAEADRVAGRADPRGAVRGRSGSTVAVMPAPPGWVRRRRCFRRCWPGRRPLARGLGRMAGRRAHRADDVLVAGTSADLARDRLPDSGFVRVGVVVQQVSGGHHHAGGAESALQAVFAHEPLLHRVELAAGRQALDGAHPVPVGHRGQHGAGLDRFLVQPGHAGAALRGVAAPMGSGEPATCLAGSARAAVAARPRRCARRR